MAESVKRILQKTVFSLFYSKSVRLIRKSRKLYSFYCCLPILAWFFQKSTIMRTRLSILIIFLLISLTGYNQSCDKSLTLWNIAVENINDKQYARAGELFLETARAESACPAADTSVIVLCYQYAGNSYLELQQYAKAIDCIEQLHSISLQANIEDKIILALYDLGLIYEKWGLKDKAIKKYIQGAEYAERYHYFENAGALYTNAALLYKSQEFTQAAIDNFFNAITNYQEINNTTQIAVCYAYIANTYLQAHAYEESVKYFQKALEIEEKQKNTSNVVLRLRQIASVYSKAGNQKRAVDTYQRVLPRITDNKQVTAIIYNNIGYEQLQQGVYQQAEENIQKALAINRTLQLDDQIATNLLNLGIIYTEQNQKAKADSIFLLAVEKYTHSGEQMSICDLLIQIASRFYEDKKWDNALNYLNNCLKTNPDDNSHKQLIYRYMAMVHIEKGDTAKARFKLQRALDLNGKAPTKEMAVIYKYMAKLYKKQNNVEKYEEYTQKCIAVYKEMNDYKSMTNEMVHFANTCIYNGFPEKSIAVNTSIIELASEQNDKNLLGIAYNNLGETYNKISEYEKALNYFHKAIAIYQDQNNLAELSTVYNNIGSIYYSWGKYDKAINFYKKGLKIDKENFFFENHGKKLNNIGEVYNMWGKYDIALDYFEHALRIAQKYSSLRSEAVRLNNMGSVYKQKHDYDKAKSFFQQALYTIKNTGNKDLYITFLNNLGALHQDLDEHDKALKNYLKALDLSREIQNRSNESIILSNIANAYQNSGNQGKAEDYYLQSVVIFKELQQQSNLSISYNNLALLYKGQDKYRKSVSYFKKSLNLIEKIILTAPFDVRPDYLEKQLSIYHQLIDYYIEKKKYENAFEIIEKSRSKVLAQLISSDKKVKTPSLKSVQKDLPDKGGVIIFSGINQSDFNAFLISQKKVTTIQINKKAFLKKALQLPVVLRYVSNQLDVAGFISMQNYLGEKNDTETDAFFEHRLFTLCIQAYRQMLSVYEPGNADNYRPLSGLIYDLLIAPCENFINNKKQLIFMPEGVLSALPFESLLVNDSTFLVEKFDVKYIQSFSVLHHIKNRQYPTGRRQGFGFGGAVYNPDTYLADMKKADNVEYKQVSTRSGMNISQVKYLRRKIERAAENKASLYNEYQELGYTSWQNLSGSFEEVQAISSIFSEFKILTGKELTENKIKQLSQKGELAKYKYLHFSTHGVTIPEVPELSALVFSQIPDSLAQNNEDGFFRTSEIAGMNIKADFVNLSACETGLGKIYQGEGIVGLSQAFMQAGANSISVSLWKVSDQSTAIFMTEMYSLIKEKNISVNKAINQVKRNFIKQKFKPDYVHPFFWAAFVFYGQ